MESLLVVCASVLAGGMQAIEASDRAPAPSSVRLIPRAGSAKNGASPGPTVSARRKGRQNEEITALTERLARQESLLAAQQERISRLEAAFDELKKQSTGSLHASIEPALNAKTIQAVALQVNLPVVGNRDPVPHPPALLPVDATTPHPTSVASAMDHGLRTTDNVDATIPQSTQVASLAPSTTQAANALASPGSAQAVQMETQVYTTRLDRLSKEVEGISKGVAGFRFSGSFRVRADAILRSGNAVAGPQQDVRGRYRARLNFDKGIDPQLDVHFQLGSGNFENPLTDQTDFGGGAVKGPIFLSEAWVNYHPNSSLNFQVGKMPEVFQDFTRFMWSNNVRLNGFQESVGTSPGDNPLGITRIDFRAGQYILTNPNIQALPSAAQCSAANPPSACIYLQAGYQPGENVRASDLFDEGVFVKGRIKPGWSQYLFSNFVLYRNANQIALGSTTAGFPVIVNNQLGVTVAGPLTGTGSATTLPGGGIFTAGHYQIGHFAYRITKEGMRVHGEEFPVFLDMQASRNFGTSFLRNAWMVTFNVGQITKAGDVRFLYFYGVKDANSMISEFADTQMGTNTGVNMRTHSLRFDVGLAKFLQWQNILYIQNEISPNDPARHLYVPLPAGTATQFRVQSSLFANF
jgi:hypothetical protein